MSHIALFQFPWQQMSVQPSRNIHHLGWVTAPSDVRTLTYWTRSTVEKEVYSEISLNFSFRNRREKWFTKSPGTKGGDPSPPNIFKKDISQSSALPLHHFASSAWMKCTNNPIQLQQDDQDFVAHKGISRCTALTKCGWKCEKCTRNWGIFQIAPIYHHIFLSQPSSALSKKRLRNS